VSKPLDDEPDRAIVKRARAAHGDVVKASTRFDDDPDLPLAEDLERFGDVTMSCHECGAELFDDVEMCHNCGAAVGPGASEKRAPGWIIAISLLLAVILTGLFLFL